MERELIIETYMNKKKVRITFKADINRDLLDNECTFMRKSCDNLLQLVYKNNQLNDQSFLDELKGEKESILACFDQPIYTKEIQNEYYEDSLNPWFLVTTFKGIIKIGWRKRVINIDWSLSDIRATSEILFANEDTTKYNKVIHAWGYEKAKEYIQKLLNQP